MVALEATKLMHEHEALTSKYIQLNSGKGHKFGGYCLINGFEN